MENKQMKVILTTANERGSFDSRTSQWFFEDIRNEADAMEIACLYSRGLSYRLEFFNGDAQEPWRTIEQKSFNFAQANAAQADSNARYGFRLRRA